MNVLIKFFATAIIKIPFACAFISYFLRIAPNFGSVNNFRMKLLKTLSDHFGADPARTQRIQFGKSSHLYINFSEKYGEMIDQPLKWKTWEPKVWSKVSVAQIESMNEHDKIIQAAGGSDKPVVVDMTNMGVGARKRMIEQINAPNRRLVAVVFDWADDVEEAIIDIEKFNKFLIL